MTHEVAGDQVAGGGDQDQCDTVHLGLCHHLGSRTQTDGSVRSVRDIPL